MNQKTMNTGYYIPYINNNFKKSWSFFLPDDGWVKLTGVEVDQTKGDGNGKLPGHTE